MTIRFWEYDYYNPHWLWLLLLLPVCFYFLLVAEGKRTGEWKFTGSERKQVSYSSKFIHYIRLGIITNWCLVLFFLILAMAKPFRWSDYVNNNNDYKNGIDIILTIDISGSMSEVDFSPNRLEAAKKVAKEFVDGRVGDRIGLVAYAGEAYTACPATTDYDVLKKQIDQLSFYNNITGGTAIGVGLGTAVTRLRSDSIPSKVIILLTDGSNNMGDISPEDAADLAKAKNVRVYTIGVGARGGAINHQTPFGFIQQTVDSDLDEGTLERIAQRTGGKYFRATDEKSLKAIYGEIEKMEKRKIIDRHFEAEPPAMPTSFLLASLLLGIIGWSSTRILFRQND